MSLKVLGKDQLVNFLAVILGGELISSLVLHYFVPILFDDIFVEVDSCLHGFWVYGFETSVHLILAHVQHCPECG